MLVANQERYPGQTLFHSAPIPRRRKTSRSLTGAMNLSSGRRRYSPVEVDQCDCAGQHNVWAMGKRQAMPLDTNPYRSSREDRDLSRSADTYSRSTLDQRQARQASSPTRLGWPEPSSCRRSTQLNIVPSPATNAMTVSYGSGNTCAALLAPVASDKRPTISAICCRGQWQPIARSR